MPTSRGHAPCFEVLVLPLHVTRNRTSIYCPAHLCEMFILRILIDHRCDVLFKLLTRLLFRNLHNALYWEVIVINLSVRLPDSRMFSTLSLFAIANFANLS